MSKREEELQRQLDEANQRIDAIQRQPPNVCVTVCAPARPERSRFDIWWNGDDPSRHMRINYG
jgi:hypothetical protein